VGVYLGRFQWDSVNWAGPSDTHRPQGAAFPVDDYTLTVAAADTVVGGVEVSAFEAVATFSVHLVP